MPLDRERLTKLMGMTMSNSDSEALVALRKANELLIGEKLTWGEVLTVLQPPAPVPPMPYPTAKSDTHLTDKDRIDDMFATIYKSRGPGNEKFWAFIDDVRSWFYRSGRLTQGQYDAIVRAYGRALWQQRGK